jgi:hypothetical protein
MELDMGPGKTESDVELTATYENNIIRSLVFYTPHPVFFG